MVSGGAAIEIVRSTITAPRAPPGLPRQRMVHGTVEAPWTQLVGRAASTGSRGRISASRLSIKGRRARAAVRSRRPRPRWRAGSATRRIRVAGAHAHQLGNPLDHLAVGEHVGAARPASARRRRARPGCGRGTRSRRVRRWLGPVGTPAGHRQHAQRSTRRTRSRNEAERADHDRRPQCRRPGTASSRIRSTSSRERRWGEGAGRCAEVDDPLHRPRRPRREGLRGPAVTRGGDQVVEASIEWTR